MIPEVEKPLFIVEHLWAVPGGTEVVVRLTQPVLRRTSALPGIAEKVLGRLPGIVRHRCESPKGLGVAGELADTESAHLLEHVALELLVCEGHPRAMAGRTTWDFGRDGQGVYRVYLGCEDVEAVRSALQEACVLIEQLTVERGRC
ncbi:MAG: hypothetical protein M1617_07660 [Actinobacteria bacterium]|nr:hypothetical protein [Actinomycetota bacterium]MCL5888145.1 hypothetical protein [Actinomycetota bacterium]